MRRDGRSLGEFALEIYDATLRERHLMGEFADIIRAFQFRVLDQGIDNDGRLVIASGGTREADYRLQFPGGRRATLEIKRAPTSKFATYRVVDLQNYIEQGDTLVLTVFGKAERSWSLMTAAMMGKALRLGEHGHHPGFGGKPTVRIHSSQYEPVFGGLRPWRKLDPVDLLLKG